MSFGIRFLIFCFFVFTSASWGLTTSDLATAPAYDLYNGMQAACKKGDAEKLFSYHSKRIEAKLLTFPIRDQIVSEYCSQIDELINYLGGDARNGKYSIKPGTHRPQQFLLCISSKEAEDSCERDTDVIIEGGVLKRDEF